MIKCTLAHLCVNYCCKAWAEAGSVIWIVETRSLVAALCFHSLPPSWIKYTALWMKAVVRVRVGGGKVSLFYLWWEEVLFSLSGLYSSLSMEILYWLKTGIQFFRICNLATSYHKAGPGEHAWVKMGHPIIVLWPFLVITVALLSKPLLQDQFLVNLSGNVFKSWVLLKYYLFKNKKQMKRPFLTCGLTPPPASLTEGRDNLSLRPHFWYFAKMSPDPSYLALRSWSGANLQNHLQIW